MDYKAKYKYMMAYVEGFKSVANDLSNEKQKEGLLLAYELIKEQDERLNRILKDS